VYGIRVGQKAWTSKSCRSPAHHKGILHMRPSRVLLVCIAWSHPWLQLCSACLHPLHQNMVPSVSQFPAQQCMGGMAPAGASQCSAGPCVHLIADIHSRQAYCICVQKLDSRCTLLAQTRVHAPCLPTQLQAKCNPPAHPLCFVTLVAAGHYPPGHQARQHWCAARLDSEAL
jgi:hypothetical protein